MRTLAPLVPFALALSALAACADATQPRVAGAERFDGTAANATTTITSTFIAGPTASRTSATASGSAARA